MSAMATITSLQTATAPRARGRYTTSIVQFARAATTTIYAALDVISDDAVTTAKAIKFPFCGRSGAVRGVTITIGETDTITPRLLLFNAEPTNHLDNAALALVADDVPKMVTFFDFVDADKILLATGINFYTATRATAAGEFVVGPVPYTTADGSLYGLLQTVAGYTPASGALFTIQLQLEID